MADELPEKVREAIEKGPQFVDVGENSHGIETYAMFAHRIARLATEEATRELRKRLERAQGALRAHANSADVLKGFEAPVPTPEQWGRIQPLASRLRDQLQAHALAIREAKESAHD